MSLPDVVAAVADVCTATLYATQVLTDPPARLPEDRTFVVLGEPGESTLVSGYGGSGRVVYQADDQVIVTWALKAARDAMAETYDIAMTAYLGTRDALFAAVKNGALAGTITGFAGIQTDIFGALDFWLPDTVFGWQIALLVRHQTEAAT